MRGLQPREHGRPHLFRSDELLARCQHREAAAEKEVSLFASAAANGGSGWLDPGFNVATVGEAR
jgi:hypothetical protein